MLRQRTAAKATKLASNSNYFRTEYTGSQRVIAKKAHYIGRENNQFHGHQQFTQKLGYSDLKDNLGMTKEEWSARISRYVLPA